MHLTPLDSPRWQELPYCWSDDRLVESLKILTREVGRPEATVQLLVKSLDTINDSIFHQQSTYPATYITVPILVDACDRLAYPLQSWIVDMVSWISIQGDPHGHLTDAELAAWFESLKIATDRCEQLVRTDCDKDSDAKLMLLGALAILNGWERTGSRIRHGNEEDHHECPKCDEALISQGYVIDFDPQLPMDDYLKFNPESSPRYVTPINRVIDLDGERTPIVPRATFPKESEAAWLIKLADETGNQKIVRWLENFFGYGCCPSCGGRVELLGD